jgi:hypothetical protein
MSQFYINKFAIVVRSFLRHFEIKMRWMFFGFKLHLLVPLLYLPNPLSKQRLLFSWATSCSFKADFGNNAQRYTPLTVALVVTKFPAFYATLYSLPC